jgi:hypothetical protein
LNFPLVQSRQSGNDQGMQIGMIAMQIGPFFLYLSPYGSSQ